MAQATFQGGVAEASIDVPRDIQVFYLDERWSGVELSFRAKCVGQS